MEFKTSIDRAALSEALNARVEEENAAHRSAFTITESKDNCTTVMVCESMHPQNSLMADVTWETCEGGSSVTVTYRRPQEGEVTPVGFLAPILAYITAMLLVGGVMWGGCFGLLHLILHDRHNVIWLLSFIAPTAFILTSVVLKATTRMRARRRFEKLMREMFDETQK